MAPARRAERSHARQGAHTKRWQEDPPRGRWWGWGWEDLEAKPTCEEDRPRRGAAPSQQKPARATATAKDEQRRCQQDRADERVTNHRDRITQEDILHTSCHAYMQPNAEYCLRAARGRRAGQQERSAVRCKISGGGLLWG